MRDALELTTHCIRCGFCLESCPTFAETGEETESPRGRIYLVRSAIEGKLTWSEAAPQLGRCLGCRACETACPSGVEYGAILELAREQIEQRSPKLAKKILLAGLTRPGALRAQLALGRLLPGQRLPRALSQMLSGELPQADRPSLPARFHLPELAEPLPSVRGEVVLLEGCAMRVLYPRVHAATRRLLRRVGFTVREVPQGCCGALHAHNGYLDEAARLGQALARSLPDLPLIVNSAGCGSTIKEYGHLFEGGDALARRTFDAAEFLAREGLADALAQSPGFSALLTYHDACHLSHGQKIRQQPRDLLRAIPGVRYVELPEADMCCGSAGIYNLLQPTMARRLVDRKWENVQRTEASLLATGNPGCHAWIAQRARESGGDVRVLHTLEALEAAFVGLSAFGGNGLPSRA